MIKQLLRIMLLLLSLGGIATSNAQALKFEHINARAHQLKLFDVVSDYQVLDTLTRFTNHTLHLKEDAYIRFYQGRDLLFDTSESVVYIPYNYVTQLYKGLESRYPEQPDVRHNIFAAAIEQFLWFELGRLIVSQYVLPLSGKEEVLLDEFAVLMLLNFSTLADDYIIDGIEAYLIVDEARSALEESGLRNEAESDRLRYQQTLCLVLGKDFESYPEKLSETRWSTENLGDCQKQYRAKLIEWVEVLRPYLAEKSLLKSLAKDASDSLLTIGNEIDDR